MVIFDFESINKREVNMKKMNSVVSTILLGLGFASASFATPVTVEYKYSVAYIKGACPASITQIIDSKDHLRLVIDVPETGAATLTNAATAGVTLSDPLTLDPVPDSGASAFRSSNLASATFQIADSSTPLTMSQAWIDGESKTGPWESAFYLNKDKSCLVMTSREAETNNLAQPTG